jgi:probable HAF family extracellular repeat protein
MRLKILPPACAACLCLLAAAARATSYEVEDIGQAMPRAQVVPLAINQAGVSVGDATVLDSYIQDAVLLGHGGVEVVPRTGDSASASGINRDGRVVGTMSSAQHPDRRAFVSIKGDTRALGTLGGATSTGRAVNDKGQVVGGSTLRGGAAHAYLYQDDAMIDLGTLGGQTSEALAINVSGTVVGRAQLRNGDTHGFAWRKGRMVDLGTLGGNRAGHGSIASAVNAGDTVVGQSTSAADPGLVHAVRWTEQDGAQDLGTLPGGTNSFGLGVNDEGDIVGGSEIRGREFHAFVVRAHGNDRMADLNDELDRKSGEGWVLAAATAINARGQIVGYGTHHGRPAAFLLTPK